MMEVIAYEMKFEKAFVEQSTIACIPFEAQYFEQYKSVYNECFYDMRKALEIEPYNFLSDYEQVREKEDGIYLLEKNGEI
ncbi:MAG: GNAT family N-acetyltransferase, partial [Lachnospiraceae bacterium]|nr:GNAT family N-acetyltransferase [Lachnospiraceae bacterium]